MSNIYDVFLFVVGCSISFYVFRNLAYMVVAYLFPAKRVKVTYSDHLNNKHVKYVDLDNDDELFAVLREAKSKTANKKRGDR